MTLRSAPGRRVPRRQLVGWMQGFEERHERGHFRRVEVPPVRRHVAAALEGLAYELIVGHSSGDPVQCGTAPTTGAADRVAVAALLRLEHQRSLTLERRPPLEVPHWDR